jgi:hypothetical protein
MVLLDICAFLVKNTRKNRIFYREYRLKFITIYDRIENGVIWLQYHYLDGYQGTSNREKDRNNGNEP